jgi:hypothetical protein
VGSPALTARYETVVGELATGVDGGADGDGEAIGLFSGGAALQVDNSVTAVRLSRNAFIQVTLCLLLAYRPPGLTLAALFPHKLPSEARSVGKLQLPDPLDPLALPVRPLLPEGAVFMPPLRVKLVPLVMSMLPSRLRLVCPDLLLYPAPL